MIMSVARSPVIIVCASDAEGWTDRKLKAYMITSNGLGKYSTFNTRCVYNMYTGMLIHSHEREPCIPFCVLSAGKKKFMNIIIII